MKARESPSRNTQNRVCAGQRIKRDTEPVGREIFPWRGGSWANRNRPDASARGSLPAVWLMSWDDITAPGRGAVRLLRPGARAETEHVMADYGRIADVSGGIDGTGGGQITDR